MLIQTKLHTIFMLIGSTECGKTTFAKEVLIPALQFEDHSRAVRSNVQYLSSDQIRQEILGYDYDKYDQVMLESSEQAFRLLFERLKLVTSFPINAEFVVVDTTGLSENFRAKVKEIARENNYNLEAIVFDYRKRDDYYASERSKKLITSHINRLKTEVLGSLAREDYTKVHRVRAKDFYVPEEGKANSEYSIAIEDLETYLSSVLPQDQQYIVVGDVHECVEDLQGLLLDYGYKIEAGKLIAGERLKRTKVILAGDWIDKGKRTREIIQFLYDNREHLVLVLGNHENFVDKYLRGEVKGVDQELLHYYFDSTQTLLQDPELLEKFECLVGMSKPFYRYVGVNGPSYYVTHAPCRNKYIGKLDTISARHQRNFRLDREGSVEEQLSFLREEAVKNHPFHIFGHIAAKQAFRIYNKIHIDTGSVHGNQLTAVTIGYKPFMRSHRSSRAVIPEELPMLFQEPRKVSLQDLGEEEGRRLRYATRHKVNFISGTMSPSDKDEETQELESLKQGLAHFQKRGVQQVVLQPKYMGSRCNIYLHKDREQCFAISRNGYRIKGVDLSEIYAGLYDKFRSYMEEHKIAMLILDGELLPWKALGEGLIERQFKPIETALGTELAFLQENSFEAAYHGLVAAYEASGFEQDQHRTAKSALSEKYGASMYQTYKYIHDIKASYVPLTDHQNAYDVYKRQLELYAGDEVMEYKPFAILKIVYEDGREQQPDWKTSEMYSFLSDDEAIVLDLAEQDSLEKAEQYFSKLTFELGMEGIVIKPETWDGSTVPYMKVRNPEYLSIIYGYDYKFPHKYRKLLKQKNIARKLRTSYNEYKLGRDLLAIPFDEISPEHEGYKEIAANLLFEVAKEREIDPRL
ncbi:metallophosphoesterase [Paenibacillus sp. GCM10012306]|uniref:metallophosphoesterase n=1 Tax=Paenibacillus sp. GCM10012306 TaxID=3317342 RepID=UPI0036075159